MTTILKTEQLVVPDSVRRRACLKAGDKVEFRATPGVITIVTKLPPADDEYTPEQRRIIDAQLDEAAEGPFHGPFDTADEMIAHIKGELKRRAAAKRTKRSLR
jgi:bifunctional DNA-binding transcriptional regulator/antitoxin component of YhaV-PrlF toxin-antitoxin module